METFWISKYALTNGIERRDLEVTRDGIYATGRYEFMRIGRDAHRLEEDAIAAAEKMRKKRIASLTKSIAKLESMSFDPRYTVTPAGKAALRGES